MHPMMISTKNGLFLYFAIIITVATNMITEITSTGEPEITLKMPLPASAPSFARSPVPSLPSPASEGLTRVAAAAAIRPMVAGLIPESAPFTILLFAVLGMAVAFAGSRGGGESE